MLLTALAAPPGEREWLLDEATIWLRQHHSQASKIWRGWDVRDGRLVHELSS
jgi:hypothetical protein